MEVRSARPTVVTATVTRDSRGLGAETAYHNEVSLPPNCLRTVPPRLTRTAARSVAAPRIAAGLRGGNQGGVFTILPGMSGASARQTVLRSVKLTLIVDHGSSNQRFCRLNTTQISVRIEKLNPETPLPGSGTACRRRARLGSSQARARMSPPKVAGFSEI